MARLPRTLLVLALALAGCHSTANVNTPGADSGAVDSGPILPDDDAGPVLKDPNIADTLGANTGAYDLNGSGRLLVIELDDHVGFELTDRQDLFVGHIDGGRFTSETLFADQETCGPVTFDGSFRDGGYTATKTFCALGSPVSGALSGARLLAPNVYRQNLAWSGAYDAVEVAASNNGCASFSGSHPVKVGVARDLDGGGTTVLLAGDGVKEQLVFGAVNDATGILSASGVDSSGNPVDSFTLYFTEDGGVGGSRTMELGDASNPCPARAQIYGSRR